MSIDGFTLSWFIVFVLVMLIAFIANLIIILAILRDKSMHTSTYFYIINVNIADILLVFSCLPERLAEVFGSTNGFHLGMFTCYLLPFLQQVSMHAALAFLLVLTIHRCYPAGVPRFLQGNLIRRQIRNYTQTLIILWTFAILINLPLFAITKYEYINVNETTLSNNNTSITNVVSEPNCFTGATEIWSRTYLILLLVFTYVITGIFLIVIYGQVIRIILASKKYTNKSLRKCQPNGNHYRYFAAKNNNHLDEQYRSKFSIRANQQGKNGNLATHSSSSSTTTGSNRRQQQQQQNRSPMPLIQCKPDSQNDLNKSSSSTNSHSAQHLQVIVMLFVVILFYILLLLPYRLLNLLYIVHNQLFQQTFMNEILFRWLLNSVRLLVFLNCALQPITYLIISSRLRQTVIKLIRSWFQCCCHCQCSQAFQTERHYKTDTRAIQAYLSQKYQHTNRYQGQQKQYNYRDNRPIQTSLNNINLISYSPNRSPLRTSSPMVYPPLNNNYTKTGHTVSFVIGRKK